MTKIERRGARPTRRRFAVLAVLVAAGALAASNAVAATSRPGESKGPGILRAAASTSPTPALPLAFPVGDVDASEPSGMSPPDANALPGYRLSYVTDFTSTSLPAGWEPFLGKPGSDPGAQWASSHVTVGDGLLTLGAWQDPAFGNEWVTGGLCQCSVARTYGAYFVRSRMTGPGPTQVELLWPASGWPPEIDFSETYGGTDYSMATVHYTAANKEIHNWIYLDMTKWHTWGVVWTPTSITYTVDGQAWGTVTDPEAIPSQPMTLDIQQQTWCEKSQACPTSPQQLEVDWVAEYTSTAQSTYVLSPFASRSATLTPQIKARIVQLAHTIRTLGERQVILVGYGDSASPASSGARQVGMRRAAAVKGFLAAQLASLGVSGISIATAADGNAVVAAVTQPSSSDARRVVALLAQ